MPLTPYYSHSGITIYHGDAREMLPQLPPCDLVLTDPPYGIGVHEFAGDKCVSDMRFLFSAGDMQIVFGANNFPDQLKDYDPEKCGWICWDKRASDYADGMRGSPFELAVVMGKRVYEIFRIQHGGVVNADSCKGNNQKRWHPTQKPISLMMGCIRHKSEEFAGFPLRIIDPFCGSGSTLIAAKKLRHKAIGIEIEEKYCEIAAKRLSQEVFQF